MFLIAILLAAAALSSCALSECSGTEKFFISVRFDWSQETDASFPIDVQSAGFRHFFCVTHNANFQFWTVDMQIAPYLKKYIVSFRRGEEDGTVFGNLTESIENAKTNSADIYDFQFSEQDILEPTESFNITITADSANSRTLLSCFSLIRPSDDWFVGVAGVSVCNKTGSQGGGSSGSEWGTGPDVMRIYGFDAGIYDSNTYVSQGELEPREPPEPVERLRVVAAEGYGTFNATSDSDSSLDNQEGQSTPACFPSGELVSLVSGLEIPIEQLELGQDVRHHHPTENPNSSQSSSVFAFSHRDPVAISVFLKITFVSSGNIVRHLRISKGHYIYIHRRSSTYSPLFQQSKDTLLVPAIHVRPGDYLFGATGDKMLVLVVEDTVAKGLYNPHTMHGNLVVNNVLVSCYTTVVKPTIASVILAPLRFIRRLRMYRTASMLSDIIAWVANANSPIAASLHSVMLSPSTSL